MAKICQNEEKMNGACRPLMRKELHDSLPRCTMTLVDVEEWSAHKEMMHPTSSEVNVDSFSETLKVCRTRELLECERRGFNNKIEETFAKRNTEFSMKLTDREKLCLF